MYKYVHQLGNRMTSIFCDVCSRAINFPNERISEKQLAQRIREKGWAWSGDHGHRCPQCKYLDTKKKVVL